MLGTMCYYYHAFAHAAPCTRLPLHSSHFVNSYSSFKTKHKVKLWSRLWPIPYSLHLLGWPVSLYMSHWVLSPLVYLPPQLCPPYVSFSQCPQGQFDEGICKSSEMVIVKNFYLIIVWSLKINTTKDHITKEKHDFYLCNLSYSHKRLLMFPKRKMWTE